MPNVPKLTFSHRPEPSELPLFRQLVKTAQKRQKNSLTERQYSLLLSSYLKSQEPIVEAPIASFYYGAVFRLKAALQATKISVRPPVYQRLLPYKLEETGFARLPEAESKIERLKRRDAAKTHGQKSPKSHNPNFSN